VVNGVFGANGFYVGDGFYEGDDFDVAIWFIVAHSHTHTLTHTLTHTHSHTHTHGFHVTVREKIQIITLIKKGEDEDE